MRQFAAHRLFSEAFVQWQLFQGRSDNHLTMGGERIKGPGVPTEAEVAPNVQSPFLPRRSSPSELFGADRMKGVDSDRRKASAQIQRTLRVWRKAEGNPEREDEEKDAKEEVSEPGEPAEQEADAVAEKVAGDLDEEKEQGDKKDAEEEKAPKIGAKLEGVGLKIYRGKKDKNDDKLEVTEKLIGQMTKAKLPYLKGSVPYIPKLKRNDRAEVEVVKVETPRGFGWTAQDGKIWIRGRAHAGYPNHWDVQDSLDAKEGQYQNVLESGEVMTQEHQQRGKK